MSLSILWISYSHDTQQPEILEPLPPLTSMYASWPPNIQYALCKPKIFVYDIPIKLQSQSYYKHVICTGSNYNSEVVLYEKLLKPGKIRDLYVTEDAEKADFFLIPFFGSCYLMNCWDRDDRRRDDRGDRDRGRNGESRHRFYKIWNLFARPYFRSMIWVSIFYLPLCVPVVFYHQSSSLDLLALVSSIGSSHMEYYKSLRGSSDLKDLMRKAGEVTFADCHKDRHGEG
ncbi:13543_t:CDS:2, partial [Entrophospora sp. SA101]